MFISGTKKTWGVLYKTQTSESLLNSDSVNCHFHDLDDRRTSQYIQCKNGKTCFNVLYIEYNNESLNVVKQNQGCWPEFLVSKTKDNCSSSLCLNDYDLLRKSNRTGLESYFCCCTGSLCNTIHFQIKPDVTVGSFPSKYMFLRAKILCYSLSEKYFPHTVVWVN